MRFLPLIALIAVLGGLPAGLSAKKKAPTPQPTPEPTPELYEAKVVLKDGQEALGKVLKYDAFFLELENKATGRPVNIPWREVREFSPAVFTGDTVVVRQYLSSELVEVGTRLTPKDPGKALAKAFWPGFLLHGAGYREAGDADMFYSLAGAELFGALVGAFGFAELAAPEIKGETKGTAQALAYSGAGIFLISWAWDLIGAPGAARGYNARYQLSLAPRPEGGGLLAARMEF